MLRFGSGLICDVVYIHSPLLQTQLTLLRRQLSRDIKILVAPAVTRMQVTRHTPTNVLSFAHDGGKSEVWSKWCALCLSCRCLCLCCGRGLWRCFGLGTSGSPSAPMSFQILHSCNVPSVRPIRPLCGVVSVRRIARSCRSLRRFPP